MTEHLSVTITKREARKRRKDALAALGMSLADWRGLKPDYDCPCCLYDDVRRMKVYPYEGDLGWAMQGALDTVRDMDFLLGEETR